MKSQGKGICGDREVLSILQAHGINARRNFQRYVGGRNSPDIDAVFMDHRLHIDVKRKERLNIREAVNQAVADADGKAFPLIIHRSSHQPWLVTFRLDDFFNAVDK